MTIQTVLSRMGFSHTSTSLANFSSTGSGVLRGVRSWSWQTVPTHGQHTLPAPTLNSTQHPGPGGRKVCETGASRRQARSWPNRAVSSASWSTSRSIGRSPTFAEKLWAVGEYQDVACEVLTTDPHCMDLLPIFGLKSAASNLVVFLRMGTSPTTGVHL